MKIIRTLLFLLALAIVAQYAAALVRDNQTLRNDLVRLHVVANSDSEEDQAVKLQVRDAIVSMLEDTMANLPSVEEAKAYLQSHLRQIEDKANEVLRQAGFTQTATVTLEQEAFPTRDYDTFSLPAGIYNALRVTIGNGEGHNWWCVLFPGLCVPASAEGVGEVAEVAGFPSGLGQALTRENGNYTIRFRILDWLGELQNKLFS